MTTDNSQSAALLVALGAAYATALPANPQLHGELNWLRAQLEGVQAQPRRQEAQRIPACRWLPATLELAAFGPQAALAQALNPLVELLRWERTYAWQPELASFFENYGYADLIGPRGLIPHEAITLGLLLLGPATIYPAHAHPAYELYTVLGGHARWQQGDAPLAIEPPGACIFHPSWSAHSMVTAEEPLLALYAWWGDLHTPAVFSY